MTIDDFLKLAGGGSAVVVCLVIAIKFLFAEKNKVEAKLDAERVIAAYKEELGLIENP